MVRPLLYGLLGRRRYLRLVARAFPLLYRTRLLRVSRRYRQHYYAQSLVRRGDYVLDIGAHLGHYTGIFARAVGAAGRVYAVEPLEEYVEVLRERFAATPQVVIIPFALGEADKDLVHLGVPDALRAVGHLRTGVRMVLPDGAQEGATERLPAAMRRASLLFADLPRLDFVKIDVEGYETRVLPDMETLLRRHRPKVQVETWGEQVLPTCETMRRLGYCGFHLQRDGSLLSLERLPQARWGDQDILFLPQ